MCRRSAELVLIPVLAACGTTGLEGDPPCWDHDDDGYEASACGGSDCDDSRPDIHPGAVEICLDGIDQDCDGLIDGPTVVFQRSDLMEEPIECAIASDAGLAWTGSDFGIAWSFNTHACGDERVIHGVYYTRLDGAGRSMMGSAFLPYTPSDDYEATGSPDLVWTGSEFGLAWISIFIALDNEFPSLYFRRLNTDGMPIDEPRLIEDYPDKPVNPKLFWTGSRYNVFWSQGSLHPEQFTLTSVPVEPDGASESFTIFEGSFLSDPDVVWTGSEFGVAWIDQSDVEGASRLHFARISEAGVELSNDEWPSNRGSPAVAFTGSEYGIVRDESGGVNFMRLTSDGEFIGDEHVVVADGRYYMGQLHWTSYGYFLVGHDGYRSTCFLQFNDTGTEKLYESCLEDTPPYDPRRRIAWTGSEFGLAWTVPPGWPIDPSTITISFARIGLCD